MDKKILSENGTDLLKELIYLIKSSKLVMWWGYVAHLVDCLPSV